MKKGKLEIDYRGQFDVDIILDGEPLTNIYGLDSSALDLLSLKYHQIILE